MFLKRLKVNSIQKYYNSVVNTPHNTQRRGKITSVGILLNYDEYNNYDRLRSIFKDIGLKDNRIKFLAYITDEKDAPNTWDAFFHPKNFGWKGKITSVEIDEFINTPFDALVCYYNNDNLELNLVTALAKADFKIGISNNEDRLYDFIINIESEHDEVFRKELVKYLKRLNKI